VESGAGEGGVEERLRRPLPMPGSGGVWVSEPRREKHQNPKHLNHLDTTATQHSKSNQNQNKIVANHSTSGCGGGCGVVAFGGGDGGKVDRMKVQVLEICVCECCECVRVGLCGCSSLPALAPHHDCK
jgi:hypothetical protein